MNILKKISRKLNIFSGNLKIGNFKLKADRTHNLPYILDAYPDYGSNIVRLASVLNTKYAPLKIIDVGGNIGDTVAMFLTDNPAYEVVSVEGDDHYFNLLSQNFGSYPNVHLLQNFLGDKESTVSASLNSQGGTLKLNTSNSNQPKKIRIITLDSLLSANQPYMDAKLLKIDTDGYDNAILRGSASYLSKTKPVLYFEYDKEYLDSNNEKGTDIFQTLSSLGYSKVIFFDNYGRLLLSTDLLNSGLISQLDRYIKNKKGAFPYYDIIVFHTEDEDIAKTFIKNEEVR